MKNLENEEFRNELDKKIKKKKNSNEMNEIDMKDLRMDENYVDIKYANQILEESCTSTSQQTNN